MRTLAACFLLLAWAALGSCTVAATQLTVVIETDIEWPGTLSTVRVLIEGGVVGGSLSPTETRDLTLGSAGPTGRLPASLAVVPRGAAAERVVRVVVVGLDAMDRELVRRSVLTGFLRERNVRLGIFLAARCRGVMCQAGESCLETTGMCGSEVVPVSSLPVLTARPAGAEFAMAGVEDAGARDTGPGDAGVDGGVTEVPRPIAPLSTSTVSSQRPTFRWELRSGTDGAEVTLCRDRALTMGCRTELATGDRVRPAMALTSGWWFWGLRARRGGVTGMEQSPVWQVWVGARNADADRDTSWGTTADFNGDGFADVVVGAPGAGRVSVYYGSAAGIPMVASFVIQGLAADEFGTSVASAGDVNGDGFADLVVGAYNADPSGRRDAGTATIFHGSAAGLPMAPTRVLEGGRGGDRFGFSVASAGDVNGDGFADIVVGARWASPAGVVPADHGTASVFYGGALGISSSPARVLGGTAIADQFGSSVASAGDVNGDGFADIVVGANEADPGGRLNAGTASVFLGSAAGITLPPHRVLEGMTATDNFGCSVASAGDLNGDGFADVVVGAYNVTIGGRNATGTASVYYGSASGIPMSPARVLEGREDFDAFGYSVASAGDVNGDGFADLVVGADSERSGGLGPTGTASVFHGGAAGIGASRDAVLGGGGSFSGFGDSVASAGDVDRDGFADLVVGAPRRMTNAGNATVFRGSAAGITTAPHRVFNGGAAGDRFGYSVASAGDATCGGFAVLVGRVCKRS